jgi:hypothetical protein
LSTLLTVDLLTPAASATSPRFATDFAILYNSLLFRP